MTEKKFLLVSLEDDKAKKIAEVLASKTCKKIIDFLAQTKEASAKDISDETKIPLNTMDYNLKKLLDSELIQKTKNFFWSQKGKKIVMYELSNKSIVISPKKTNLASKIKSIVPVLIFGGIGALIIKNLATPVMQDAKLYANSEIAGSSVISTTNFITYIQSLPDWYWFSLGIIVAVLVMTIINWRKL